MGAEVRIIPLFSLQAEAVFTWDNASVWTYAQEPNMERYARRFSTLSLQFPLLAKLNFYPGKFRLSPFCGAYFLLPLGSIKTSSPYDTEQSLAYSVPPPFGILGGLSAAYPLGPGMIFADLRYAADLGEPELSGGPEQTSYRRHMISLSLGYEFGFFKKREKTGSAK
jgi:hypothetical protein